MTYDWFIDEDKVQGRLIEIYKNVDAFRLHLTGKVQTELAPQYRGAIEWVSFGAFGEMPKEFYRILKAVPNQCWTQPSMHVLNALQGLSWLSFPISCGLNL